MDKKNDLFSLLKVLGLSFVFFLLLVLANYSTLIGLILPIGISILCLLSDRKKVFFVMTVYTLLACIYKFDTSRLIYFVVTLIISMAIILVIKFDFEDKKAVAILFVVNSIVFNLFFFYMLKASNFGLSQITQEIYKLFESEGLEISKQLVSGAVSKTPSVICILALIYSLISLKLVRNYLNYKNQEIRDMNEIDRLRLTFKDVGVGIVLSLVVFLIFHFLGIKSEYILGNIISLVFSIFAVNGIFFMDFSLKKRSPKAYRIFVWILTFLMFSFLSYFFAILGIIDLIFDLRRKMEFRYGKEK